MENTTIEMNDGTMEGRGLKEKITGWIPSIKGEWESNRPAAGAHILCIAATLLSTAALTSALLGLKESFDEGTYSFDLGLRFALEGFRDAAPHLAQYDGALLGLALACLCAAFGLLCFQTRTTEKSKAMRIVLATVIACAWIASACIAIASLATDGVGAWLWNAISSVPFLDGRSYRAMAEFARDPSNIAKAALGYVGLFVACGALVFGSISIANAKVSGLSRWAWAAVRAVVIYPPLVVLATNLDNVLGIVIAVAVVLAFMVGGSGVPVAGPNFLGTLFTKSGLRIDVYDTNK